MMTEDQIPIEYELLHTATLADITVLKTEIEPTTDDDSWVRIEAKVGNEEEDENDVEWSAFGLIYALGVLSFTDARPRGVSEIDFEKKDDWYVGDMLRHLRFERGELHFYADYVRGRMLKTTVLVRPDGTFRLETVNRGEAATRWISKLQGKKLLSVVEGGQASNKLEDLKQEISSCRLCHEETPPLTHPGAFPIFQRGGNPDADIVFVFEAPNYADTFDRNKGYMSWGEQSDPTGRLFEELLDTCLEVGIDDVVTLNTVLCLPATKDGEYPVSANQRRHCAEWILKVIDLVDPQVVVTMGAKALDFANQAGELKLQLQEAVGKPIRWRGRHLVPLYHTSSQARKTRSSDQQRQDFRELRRFLESLQHDPGRG
jgi:DNA polymerase